MLWSRDAYGTAVTRVEICFFNYPRMRQFRCSLRRLKAVYSHGNRWRYFRVLLNLRCPGVGAVAKSAKIDARLRDEYFGGWIVEIGRGIREFGLFV